MATKTTGAEFLAFYSDDTYWLKSGDSESDEVWHEDLVLEVNGIEQTDDFSISEDLKVEDQVKIVYGHVLSTRQDFENRSFESFFKAWRKQQNTAYLCVAVPKEKLDNLRAAILAAGGSIK